MEMPWVWRRGYSRHREREFIFSHFREWRVFQLHHLLLLYKLIFIWTGVLSGRVGLKRQMKIDGVGCQPSSRRWTWKKTIKFGLALLACQQGRTCMTTVAIFDSFHGFHVGGGNCGFTLRIFDFRNSHIKNTSKISMIVKFIKWASD
jgi:hypothetical protein